MTSKKALADLNKLLKKAGLPPFDSEEKTAERLERLSDIMEDAYDAFDAYVDAKRGEEEAR